MEAREIPRLPEDIEAEQRYLAELKSERFHTALEASQAQHWAADANVQRLSDLADFSQPAAASLLVQSTPEAAASRTENRVIPEVEDSDEAALALLRELGLDQTGESMTPKYGVIYRMARWLDDLLAAIFKRPTF